MSTRRGGASAFGTIGVREVEGGIDLERRRIVLGGAGVGAAWLIGLAGLPLSGCSDGVAPDSAADVRRRGLRAARRIGDVYLEIRASPERSASAQASLTPDAVRQQIADELAEGSPGELDSLSVLPLDLTRPVSESIFESEWAATMLRRTREDFSAGRTIQVERWWLSITEVRVCALIALA